MRTLLRWLDSREAAIAVVAGLVGPLLWTTFESQLVHYVHEPLSEWIFGDGRTTRAVHWFWRGNQLVYGVLSAALFAIPLSVAFRRDRFGYGVLFVATFVASMVAGLVYAGAASNLGLLFSLPDTWALIGGLLLFFWLMSRRQRPNLPSNSTLHTDARTSAVLHEAHRARAGERER